MKAIRFLGVLVVLSAAAAIAADLKSGPQPGEPVGAFEVTKVAGAPNDGVPAGEELCYRCKLGNRPVVMVFAHKVDSNLVKLANGLDGVVAKNQDKKMGSFVNLLGDNADGLKKDAQKLAADAKLENVAVVVPQSHKSGPESYSINDKADVTVLIYKDGMVKVNYALASGGLNEDAIKKILDDTKQILN